MRRATILCLSVVALACAGPAPASAQQVVEGVYEVTDPDAPLDFVQRQALGELREKDYHRYMSTARDAKILLHKRFRNATPSVKPIAEWTQGDLWKFRRLYDLYAQQTEGLERWSVHELATMIDFLTSDIGGDGGEGGGED